MRKEKSPLPPFDFIRGFGCIHHRFLNNLTWLDGLRDHVDKRAGFTEIAEGDVCWYVRGTAVTAVMLHPSRANKIPAYEDVRGRIDRGELFHLHDVLRQPYAHIPKVIELKTGQGNVRRAMEHILEVLETHAAGRYWIDTFSPGLLTLVKTLSPTTPTSLHTRLGVYGPLVVKTAYSLPPVMPLPISRLKQADAITVTYKYSPARFLKPFGCTIDGIHAAVGRAGKALILGGVERAEVEAEAAASGAIAFYQKSDHDPFKRLSATQPVSV